MVKLDTATITRRSIRGLAALSFVQVINTVLVFLLTIFIDPRTFGVYFVVSAGLAFLTYFSDIGLAAALIQKKEKVTRDDLVTTFTIQQVLVVMAISIAFLLSPQVAMFYDLDRQGKLLFQALLVSFFLSSLKTIPSVNLERNLEFQKLTIPQIAEALVFNLVAVVLATRGFGITSFTIAVLARGIVGLVLIYLIAPWHIGLGISMASARKLLSFGVPFQANSFLALLKDDLLIIVLGKVLALTEVGFIGFAQKWAFMPLRLIMDKVIRVTFPAISRMQADRDMVGLAIEKTIFMISFLIVPLLFGLVVLSPYTIDIIPQYRKWEPAIPLLAFFALNGLFSSISTPLTNVLNALGKIKTTLRLMIFWTVATWVLTLILIRFFGFAGVAVASAIIATSVVLVVYLARRYVQFAIARPTMKPLLSGIVMTVVLYVTAPIFVTNIPTLILAVFEGAGIYFAVMFLIARKEVTADVKTVIRHLR